MTFQFAGTVIHGTLLTRDMIPAFMDVLRVLDPQQAGVWSERERKCMNAVLGIYNDDPEYTREDVEELLEDADAFVNDLIDKLNEVAPEGYRFGTLEGDGSDFGFWPLDPVDVARERVPDGHDELFSRRRIFYIDIGAQVEGGFVPSLVFEGVAGHYPLIGNGRFASPWVWGPTFGDAQRMADEANEQLGYSKVEALLILASSMRASNEERS